MPPTTENIPDRPGFDVYAMLLVLSFTFLLGATLLLNDDLDKNWGFWLPPENRPAKAERITQINEDPAKYREFINVREEDLKEWALAREAETGKNFKWPEGYNPLENPVLPGADNLQTLKGDDGPNSPLNKLMQGYKGPNDVNTPAPTEAPPTPPATTNPAGTEPGKEPAK
jgi:hypothetical protein